MTSKNRLADYLNKKSLEEKYYFLDVMPAHLARQGMKKEFCKLLSDYDFMYSKISNFGTKRLIDDYEFSDSIGLDPEEKESLRLIQSALKLSEPFLAMDNNQLTSQLWGRLPQEYPMIKKLLLQAKENCPRPFLHLYTSSLTQAGGSLIRQIPVSNEISASTITPNGKQVICGFVDGSIEMWDIESGKEMGSVRLHNNRITDLAVISDNTKLISRSSYEDTTKILDIDSGKELKSIDVNHSNYSSILTPDGTKLISGSNDGIIRIWDIDSGKELKSIQGYDGEVLSLIRILDHKKLIAGNEEIIRIWDIDSGKELNSIKVRDEYFHSITMTSSKTKILYSTGSPTVWIWDLENGKEISLEQQYDDISSLTTTPDGTKLISGSNDGIIRIWDIDSGKELKSIQGHSGEVLSLIMTSDGKSLVSTSKDNMLRLWNIESVMLNRSRTESRIKLLTTTPDGTKLISGSNDGIIRIWDIDSGKELKSIQGYDISSLTTTPDGTKLISGSNDGIIRIWDIDSGNQIKSMIGHIGFISSMTVTPDGKKIISGSHDGTIKIWSVKNFEEIDSVTRGVNGLVDSIISIAIFPSGKKLVCSFADDTIRVLEIEAREIRFETNPRDYQLYSVTSEEGILVIADKSLGFLEIVDIEKHKKIGEVTREESVEILSLITIKNGKKIVSGYSDGDILVHDIETRNEFFLHGKINKISLLTGNFKGSNIVTASNEGLIELWDIDNRYATNQFLEKGISALAISEKDTVIAGDVFGRVHFLRIEQ